MRLKVPSFLLLIFAILHVSMSPRPAHAGLKEYVEQPESAFQWKFNGKKEQAGGVVYDLHLVSQEWHGIKWEHQLQVFQPKDVQPNATLLLYNTGGKTNPRDALFAFDLAKRIKAPMAVLYGIPNQPLLGGKSEDALIAETFVRYLETRDDTWPLLFAMVKSVVKAMDVLQAFGKEEWETEIKDFIVFGGSKRGWTTWLTGASDPRVKAIAPLVIDTLNMRLQMPHQLECFGEYSEMIGDYTERGLVPLPNTPEARKLWTMVDPYAYREQLTLPKLIVNGNNDPYWTVDALNLYWDGLEGDKWVTYIPNAGHDLRQVGDFNLFGLGRAVNALAAFVRHQIADKPMPKLTWKHDDDNGKMRLTIQSSEGPKSARLWVAHSETKDFRKSKWIEQPTELDGSVAVGRVATPKSGYLAYYGEMEFEMEDGLKYALCTQIRVAGE